jgi:hypothetical protein
MKKLLLLTLAACLPFSMAVAQMDPANYHIYFGTQDGSVLSVGLDRDIEIPCWGSTDPDPASDSVIFMHNPLGSEDLYITARLGGFFPPPPGPGGWDDISFLVPNVMPVPPGFTNQSVLGFAYLVDPPSRENWFFTLGAQQMISTYRMHTTADPAYLNQTVCPFIEGTQPQNGGPLWGNQTGTDQVIPTPHFACLYFSPNADPVWTVYPAGPVAGDAGIEVCFHLEGTDSDTENDLHIQLISGGGTFTETSGGPGGLAAGDWCGTLPVGIHTISFVLNDGTVQVPLDVRVEVGAIELEIGCVESFPGADAIVPIFLHTNGFFTGGFEILIGTDPTGLTFNSSATFWTPRINGGSEYSNQVVDPVGPGTVRFVWIADINDGVHTSPAAPGHDAILWLQFHVSPGLPFGMHIPIDFLVTDFNDNTISDSTGYIWVHPLLTSGCVNTVNPQEFKGDPNMNCFGYEIADVVLVAQRLIQGFVVWAADDVMANEPPCTRHFAGNDGIQEASSDLNDNGFTDIADLVRFINIINGFAFPPKLDPVTGIATVSIGNGAVNISSGVEVGGVLIKIQGEISDVVGNGMDILTHTADGATSVLVYSLAGDRVAAGRSTLFTFQGEGTIAEVSVSDSYGRLLDASARIEAPLPTEFAVKQNYPNPFNAKTLINFALPTASDVSINIYNITGQVVETINGHYDAGYHQVTWNANEVSSGIYFAKIASGDQNQTVKMTLVK